MFVRVENDLVRRGGSQAGSNSPRESCGNRRVGAPDELDEPGPGWRSSLRIHGRAIYFK